MNTTEIPTNGSLVTFIYLPGRPSERTITGRLFELDGALVTQPRDAMSDEFLTVVLRDGTLNPNIRLLAE